MKSRYILLISSFCAVAPYIVGCSESASTLTIDSVTEAETALTAADQLALVYVTSPLCTAATKAKIKTDAQTAYNAVQAAAANTGTIAAAVTAIQALTSDVPQSAPSK